MKNQPPDDFKYPFAAPSKEVIVPTGLMREVVNRTSAIHPGIALWYGESRLGKSTTAKYMVDKIAEAYDPNDPHAYRAVHYEVGQIASWTGNEQKKGIKSLYFATLGRLDEGVYRHDPPESLAAQIVLGLRRKNIRMICVDEAGTLSLEALRGMILVYDTAKNHQHPLSLVFIGMDDLPTKVKYLPQVENRIDEWCFFEAYGLAETGRLLSQLHSHFKKLDFNDPEQFAQVECMYEMFGGFPGLIVPFLKKLDRYQQLEPEKITVKYLRGLRLRTLLDKEHSIKKSLEIYRGKPGRETRRGYARRKAGEAEGGNPDGKKAGKKAAEKSPEGSGNSDKRGRKSAGTSDTVNRPGQ